MRELARERRDLRIELERLLDEARDLDEVVDALPHVLRRDRAPLAAEPQAEEVAGDDHRGERLGGGDADLGSRVHVEHARRLARQGGADDVRDGEDRAALEPRRLHRAERVGRLARLGDGDHERLGAHDRVAVAELGGQVRLGRQARQALDHRAREHRRVEGRAARDQHDALDRAHGVGVEPHVGEDDAAGLGGDAAAEGVGDRARLLVDLLEHEVPIAALLRHDRVPEDLDRVALDGLALERRELDAARRHHRHLVVLEDHDVARVREDRRDVGGDEHLAAAEPDDHAPRSLLRGDEPVRRRRGDDDDRVRAPDLGESRLHRPVEAAARPEVVLDQVGQHLGVRLGPEAMPLGEQALLDLEIVLEDPVVDDDERALAVGVRVRVLLGRPAVGGPARVADARRALDGPLAQDAFERLEPPGGAPDLQPPALQDGDAGRVVAAVLEAPEPLDDDRGRALVTDVADDPAHGG